MAMFLNTPLPYKRYKKISETTYFVDKSLILMTYLDAWKKKHSISALQDRADSEKRSWQICWELSLERPGMLRRYLII